MRQAFFIGQVLANKAKKRGLLFLIFSLGFIAH